MANNLKDHLKEVADAIRAKKGTSDLINPQNFATEIEGISGGGSGESGDSNIEYLDVSGLVDVGMLKTLLLQSSYLVKKPQTITIDTSEGANTGTVTMDRGIAPSASWGIVAGRFREGTDNYFQMEEAVTACSLDFGITIINETIQMTLGEMLVMVGFTQEQLDAIPRLTKEQFYDLNS